MLNLSFFVMRPMALKRSRNGKFRVRRNPRYRPIKLGKREKKVVRVAVRKASARAETKVDVDLTASGFAQPSITEFSSYPSSFTWFKNAVHNSQGMLDGDVIGSEIFIKKLVFDMVFSTGKMADNVVHPFPVYIRVDLIQTGLHAGDGNSWLTNSPINAPFLSFWDPATQPGDGDEYIWGGPPTGFNRRHFKRLKTKIIQLNTNSSRVRDQGDVTSNVIQHKRIRISQTVNKKWRFYDKDISATNDFGRQLNYMWVLSFWAPDGKPSGFDPDWRAFYMRGFLKCIFTDS